jgi:hypothetical protein
MRNKLTFALLLLALCAALLVPTPGSARRLYYAEEFYLYVLNLYHTNPNLERNIRFMQWALVSPFDNPVRSLALIQTENDFARYKTLFKMHVNMLIIDSTLQLARRYDKEHVYFFNLEWAKSLKESFAIARYFYEVSLNYWDEVLKHAETLNGMEGRITLEEWEDEYELIRRGEFDYKKIIDRQIERLEGRAAVVDAYLARAEGKTGPATADGEAVSPAEGAPRSGSRASRISLYSFP